MTDISMLVFCRDIVYIIVGSLTVLMSVRMVCKSYDRKTKASEAAWVNESGNNPRVTSTPIQHSSKVVTTTTIPVPPLQKLDANSIAAIKKPPRPEGGFGSSVGV